MAPYDIVGNIVIIKFDWDMKLRDKKKEAEKFLKKHKSVRTVLEKYGKFSGRLRTQKTRVLAGERTKEALYRENGCVFRFNADTCYFSPRLSAERKEVALKVKRKENVLIMFGGVAPFGIVIARLSKAGKIVSVELGRECNKYALQNVKRNKLGERVQIVGGDVRKVLDKKNCRRACGIDKFNRIVMARPNLKDNFLDVAFSRISKSGIIHYYGFYSEDLIGELKEMIFSEAKKARKKIRLLRVVKAGEVGVRKYRYRVDVKVL